MTETRDDDQAIRNCAITLEHRVLFRDIDMFEHVNNVTYLSWCEDVRIRYFEEVTGEPVKGERGMIIVRLEYHFRRQVYYNDRMIVGARVPRLGTKSFDMDYEIWNQTRGERAGFGRSTLVGYDYVRNRSIVLPDDWRRKIEAAELVKPVVAGGERPGVSQ